MEKSIVEEARTDFVQRPAAMTMYYKVGKRNGEVSNLEETSDSESKDPIPKRNLIRIPPPKRIMSGKER